jgi:Virulence factor
MATYSVIAWKGIPASVEAQDGPDSVTRELSERFQMLIDSVAMQRGLHGSDEYLESWTREDSLERPGTAREVADAVVADLEGRFAEFASRAFTIPPTP